MRALLLHWANSVRFMVSRPLTWLVLLVGCVLGVANSEQLVHVLWAHRPPGAAAPALLDHIWHATFMTLPLLWLVLLAAVLPSTQRTPAGSWRVPLPALPIARRSRLLGEVLAASLLVELLRMGSWGVLVQWSLPTSPPYLQLFSAMMWAPPVALLALAVSLPLLRRLGSRPAGRAILWGLFVALAVLVLARPTALSYVVWPWRVMDNWAFFAGDLILGLPLLVAVGSSRREPVAYVTRIAVAYAATFALVVTVLALELGATILYPGALALAVVMLASMGREPSWSFAPLAVPALSLRPRAGFTPLRRLHADVRRRLALVFGLIVLPALVATGLAPVVARATEHPGWLVFLALGPYVIIAAALYPLGLPLFGYPPRLFNGRYCASWSWLPVRPEAIRRAAYVHGLLIGAAFVAIAGIVWLGGRLSALRSRAATVSGETWLFVVLVAFAWAGFTVAAAAGRGARGIASAAGILLTLAGLALAIVYGQPAMHLAVLLAAFTAVLPLPLLRRGVRS